MTHLAPGMPAPDFALTAADGSTVRLSDLRGRRVIVWFFPEALTPACQQQACDFRDSLPALAAQGTAVLGISRDSVAKLAEATATDSIPYPLLSDEDLTVHEAWGTFGEKQLYGKTVMGVRRSSFVVGPDGILTHVFYNTKAKGHLSMLDKRLGFTA